MDIEKKLDDVIEKYNMQIDLYDVIKKEVKQYLLAHCENKKVGIMCGGVHTQHMLDDFGDILNILCIFDNDKEKTGMKMGQIPICSIEWEAVESIDRIIVSTSDYREEVKQQLLQMGISQEKIVDIYDYIDTNGLSSNAYHWIDNVYVPFVFMNNQYEKASLSEDKERWLLELIKGYLNIRDIVSVKKYIGEYVTRSYSLKTEMMDLQGELDDLIEKINSRMHARKQKDIIWFWQDALYQGWIKYMPFYNEECRKQGLLFTNCYSTPNSTRWIYEMAFHKRYEIDDKAYEVRENQKCEWMEKLIEQGYDCVRVPSAVEGEIQKLDGFDCRKGSLISYDIATSQLYWTAVNYVLNSEKSVFILIHSMLETHQPCCSPYLKEYKANWPDFGPCYENDINKKLYSNLIQNCLYLNDITKFYSEMFSANSAKIYMSDHGVIFKRWPKKWYEEPSHCNFIVTGENIAPEECDDLFSFYNFDKVIDYILQPNRNNLDRIFQKEILLQGIDAYNKHFIETFIKAGIPEYCISFRGIRSKEDLFILLRTGEEFYYRLPDDETNYINASQYQDRIEELRKKAGNNFIDICREEKFKHTHILYDYLEQQKD